MTFGFTGNLITSAEQHRAVKSDLAHVGMWGVGLILGVVLLFFLRFRTLLAMSLTIGVGCVWAFGMARLTVGYLNTATGFLVSIIAGNGINFGIIYMARFLEARRDEKLATPAAIRVSHRDTHTATLAAAGAAMIAYGSLAATDFHGFKHFGIIGGAGMILCWIATYVFLPAFLVLSERYAPMFTEKAQRPGARALKGLYGYPFALAARKFPRAISIAGAALGVAALVLTVRYFITRPDGVRPGQRAQRAAEPDVGGPSVHSRRPHRGTAGPRRARHPDGQHRAGEAAGEGALQAPRCRTERQTPLRQGRAASTTSCPTTRTRS